MPFYVNDHNGQGDEANSPITQSSGCTWTSVANGIDAATGGDMDPTPDRVHRQVDRSEETVPSSPGWSIPDADLACSRLGVPFRNLTGGRWEGVKHEHEVGRYVIVQGDSDRFGNRTCSGKFDGDHCVGIHPDNKRGHIDGDGHFVESPTGDIHWRINDPICGHARYERPSVLRAYMEDLDVRGRYGAFADPVPQDPPVVLRFGASALPRPQHKVFRRRAVVRDRPSTSGARLNVRHKGGEWTAYQLVRKSDGLWYGNLKGRRWAPESAF